MQYESKPEAETSSVFSLIPASVRENLEAKGITKPTPIQQSTYIPIIEGRDVIAQSRTGSGKTLAFGLPAFARLEKPKAQAPRLLVLTPTRELAEQVANVFEENFRPMGFKTLAVTGGKSYRHQISTLNRGVDAVVATPGRLTDLLEQKALRLTEIELLVLDEMDEMLDFGFSEDLLKIKDSIGKKAQTLLFSATFPPKVNSMAKKMVSNPFEVKIAASDTTTGQIEHGFMEVKMGRNLDALLSMLLYYSPEHALIFCRTKEETRKIYSELQERGFAVGVLNGDMTQNDRSLTMEKFRNKSIKFLVATDVAARGIDINQLSHVINYTVPTNVETYTHRAGRTGRAGAIGKAWTIVPYNERREFQFVCSKVKINPARIEIPNIKKVAEQFLNHMLFQFEAKVAQGVAPSSKMASSAVDHYVNGLDAEKAKETLSIILKTEISRQLGKGLNVEDLGPAFKTEFGSNVQSAPANPRFSERSERSGGGSGYSGGGGRRPYSRPQGNGGRPSYGGSGSGYSGSGGGRRGEAPRGGGYHKPASRSR